MLADLIHGADGTLEASQIRKTVHVYSKNLLEGSPDAALQSVSVNLLLRTVGCIANIANKADARYHIFLILNAIRNKFAAMKRQYSNAVKLSKLYTQSANDSFPYSYLADKKPFPDWDEIDIDTATPIAISSFLYRGADPVADNDFFKKLVNGLQDIFHQLKACEIQSSTRFTAEEGLGRGKLFRKGACVFCCYMTDQSSAASLEISALEAMVNCYISGTQDGKDPRPF